MTVYKYEELKCSLNAIFSENIGKKMSNYVGEKYYLRFRPELHVDILAFSKDNNMTDYKFSELIYLITNELTARKKCKNCDTTTSYKGFTIGYGKYCTALCSSKDIEKTRACIENSKKTIRVKYGVDNVSQMDSIKKKKMETSIKNYGVAHNLQRQEIKDANSASMKTIEHSEAIKAGIMKSLGVSNPSLNAGSIIARGVTYTNKKIAKLSNYAQKLGIEFSKYVNMYDIEFSCDTCKNTFNINYQLFNLRRNRNETICTKCNAVTKPISTGETELLEYIRSVYTGEIATNDRDILGGKEIDIFLPELRLAFEYNGLYWHSELEKDINYHLDKTDRCLAQDINLIHVYEDDWKYKNSIIKSIINNKLQLNDKIYARKCIVKPVSFNNCKEFLVINHIQGHCVSSNNLGLYHRDELVSLMTFGQRNISNKSQYELLRFCNKLNTNVIGGASRLFKRFLELKLASVIVSYADKSFSVGKLYDILSFQKGKDTQPGYEWVVDGKRYYRSNFNKANLSRLGWLLDDETEAECMHRLGHYRIYNSGSMVFKYNA